MSDKFIVDYFTFEFQKPVETRTLSVPPTPVKGKRYLIAAGASGDWVGQSNNIATYNGTVWEFMARREGLICWVKDENLYLFYDGSAWGVWRQGLFELDINGDCEPITDVGSDNNYELDGSDDIMPKA